MPREYTEVELPAIEETVMVPNDPRGLPLLFIQDSASDGRVWWQIVDRRAPKGKRLSGEFDTQEAVERALLKAVR